MKGTCGHDLEDFKGAYAHLKGIVNGVKTVIYAILCIPCYLRNDEEGKVLHSEKDFREYLGE